MAAPRSPRILIIDNDDALAEGVAVRLRALKYDCTLVANGQEGIETFESARFDLILTDLNMPQVNGISLIRRLHARSPIPIIVMTGYERAYRRELEGLEEVVVISKPFRAQAIIDLVETELALRGFLQAA